MNSQKHFKDVSDNVKQMHKLEKGYKTISKCLDVSGGTFGSVIRKWRLQHTTQTLSRKGQPLNFLHKQEGYLEKPQRSQQSL